MAQGEETFLYRIITQLDDEEAFSQVSQELSMIGDATEQAEGKMQNLLSEIRKMSESDLSRVQEQLKQLKGPTDISGLKNMKGDLEALEKNLEDGTEASKRLNKVIEGVESADFKVLSDNINDLKKNLSGTSTTFSRIENQLEKIGAADNISEARQRFQRLKKMVLENEEVISRLKSEGNFDAMAQRVSRLNDVFEDTKNSVAAAGGSIEKKLGTSLDGVNTQVDRTRLKTNQMSQAILQGAQDAQFGVIGVANNIQMLGESISRQMNKGVSGTRLLKSTLSNLFMGPMAIGTLITTLTLLAQNWDSVESAAVSALNSIGIEVEAQESKLQSLADSIKNVEKQFGVFETSEFLEAFKTMAQEGEGGGLIERAKNQLEDVQGPLARYRKELNKLRNTYPQIVTDGAKLVEMTGAYSLQQEQAMRAVGLTREEVTKLQNRKESLQKILKASNSETNKLANLQRQLETALKMSSEEAKKHAKRIMEMSENTGKASKPQEGFLDLLKDYVDTTDKLKRDFRLVNGEIESFAAFTQEAAIGTDASFDENLVGDYFEKQAEEAKKAREEAQQTENKIAQLRAEILPGLAGKFASIQADLSQRLSETSNPIIESLLRQRAKGRRTKAIRGWWKSTMKEFVQQGQAMKFDLGPGFQDVFLPFGGNKGKMKEKAKDQMQIAQEAFRAEQERLRGQQELLDQRSELGPQESSLFGLGVAQMENKADERLQFQMRIARREKNIQKARLQNQQSLLDERFSRGKIKWQQWMRETANVQKQIAMTEQQWYRKRENLQDQHVKKKIRRASQFGQEFLGQTSSFASTWFNTWKNEREQE